MRWTRARACVAVTLLSGAALAEERPRRAYQVAAIGDSLTDPRSHGGKYLSYLRERCPESRFDNYGKGGENVAMMRRRFARDVLGEPRSPRQRKPAYSHVVVFGGVNDLLRDRAANRTTDKVLADLGQMYAMAKKAGVAVVGVTLTPWGGFSREYNPRRARATRDINAWILGEQSAARIDHALDAHSLLSCGDPDKLCPSYEMKWIRDGLHFNQVGHERLGQALYEGVFADCR